MVLVQAENHKHGGTDDSPNSLDKGRPSSVLDHVSPSVLSPMVRVCMSLRGHDTNRRRYVCDGGGSIVLVVEGVGPWSCASSVRGKDGSPIHVVTKSTSEALEALLEQSRWRVIDAVVSDVRTRDAEIDSTENFGMHADELLRTAVQSLSATLVLNEKSSLRRVVPRALLMQLVQGVLRHPQTICTSFLGRSRDPSQADLSPRVPSPRDTKQRTAA